MKKYLINDVEINDDNFISKLQEVAFKYACSNYDDLLDGVYGCFNVVGIEFNASDVFKTCNKIAYTCELDGYYKRILTNAIHDLKQYGKTTINNVTFIIKGE